MSIYQDGIGLITKEETACGHEKATMHLVMVGLAQYM
jgi:hypothetical protein